MFFFIKIIIEHYEIINIYIYIYCLTLFLSTKFISMIINKNWKDVYKFNKFFWHYEFLSTKFLFFISIIIF